VRDDRQLKKLLSRHLHLLPFKPSLGFPCLLHPSLISLSLSPLLMLSSCGLRLHWLLQRRRRHRPRNRRRTRRTSGQNVADDVALDPVLLVSGMGGSILNAKKKSNSKFELRVWVRIFLANLEFRKYIWSIYNPDTGVHSLISYIFRFHWVWIASLHVFRFGLVCDYACQLNSELPEWF
jgi:hypothetical protein